MKHKGKISGAYEKFMDDKEFQEYIDELYEDEHALTLRNGANYESAIGEMYAIIRNTKPEVIVETGVQNGFSTEVFLRALEKNGKGKLYSIDSGPNSTDGSHDIANKTEEGIPGKNILNSLMHRWELRVGFSSNELPKLMLELKDTVDIFHHDSDHSGGNVRFEVEEILKYAKPGTYIALHDYSGQFNHPEIETVPTYDLEEIERGKTGFLSVWKVNGSCEHC